MATIEELEGAYRFFNETLFGNKLPSRVPIRARDLDINERLAECEGWMLGYSINFDPRHLATDGALVSLVHEMAHIDQWTPNDFHGPEWTAKMRQLGFRQEGSSTGLGDVIAGGPYDRAVSAWRSEAGRPRSSTRKSSPAIKSRAAAFVITALGLFSLWTMAVEHSGSNSHNGARHPRNSYAENGMHRSDDW